MNLPQRKNKHQEQALFGAKEYIEYQRKKGGKDLEIPARNILCYQPSLIKEIKEKYQIIKRGCLSVLINDGVEVALWGNFGIGAPRAAMFIEDLIARGGKLFLSIGSAGGLQPDLDIGDIVLIEESLRDEGTSYHYQPAEKFSRASQRVTKIVDQTLKDKGYKYHRGKSWTTDAPYRETIGEVTQYREEGILTVEMELAALFAVAEYRKVELGALLMISDSLADLEWNPQFDNIKKEQLRLFEIAFAAIIRM